MSNHPINLSRDTGLLRPALGKSISASQSPGRHQWKQGMCGKAECWRRGRLEGWVGGGRGCLIYWFNSCRCSSLCRSVREGKWSMRPKTPRPNHIFSQLLSRPSCLSVSLAPSALPPPPPHPLPAPPPFTLLHFSHFLPPLAGLTGWRTDWLTPCAQHRPRWKWKSLESSTYLTDSVTRWLCVCRLLFFCFVVCSLCFCERQTHTAKLRNETALEARPAKLITGSVHLLH